MIRRNVPLGDSPREWLLISQVEHARISHQLAAAWRDLLPSATPGVREEFLTGLLHHDDGWQEWADAPKIDPVHGRPFGFTEMPPADAQAIWTRSIDACEQIGPLAAWVVASHFIALQSKQDDDYHEWRPWLAEQGARLAAWQADWLSQDDRHTTALAQECLHLLQTFDWLSLWLCCRAPIDEQDPVESLTLGDGQFGFGPVEFQPTKPQQLSAAPWPFTASTIEVDAAAVRATPGSYTSGKEVPTRPARLTLRLGSASD